MKKKLSILFLTAMFTFLFSVGVLAATPGKVTGVKQTGAQSNVVNIQFNAVLGEDIYYEVSMSNDGKNYSVVLEREKDTALSVNNLTTASTYYLRVRAMEYTWSSGATYGPYSDAIKVVTSPDKVEKLTQTGATTSSFTISWDKVNGATSYNVYGEQNNQEVLLGNTTSTSYTVKGINNKVACPYSCVYVRPVRSEGGFSAENDTHMLYVEDIWGSDIKVIPTTPTSFKITSYWTWLESVRFEADTMPYASKLHYEVRNSKSKKITSGTVGNSEYYNYADFENIKRDQFYKVRVRASVDIGNKTYYSKWSKYKYFSNGTTASVRTTKNKLRIKWNKCKGATSYTVYVSTREDAGFRKVKTTKKTYLNLKKFKKKKIKKNRKYYVKVVANKKVGKTTYKSHELVYSN